MTRAQKNEREHAKAEEKEQEEEEVWVEVPVEATSAELERLKQELAEKTALVDEFLSRLKYLQADFENYKKMVARERELYEQCATEALIKRLLPLIDTVEAALASADTCEDLKTFVDGVELIYRDLMDELKTEGLKPIKAVGEKFLIGQFFSDDVALHERGLNRVGNLHIDNQSYMKFENILSPMLKKIYEKKKRVTPSEIFKEIGLSLDDESSILYQAAKRNVPVFCPAITDGAFGFHLYMLQQKHPDFMVDVVADFKNIL